MVIRLVSVFSPVNARAHLHRMPRGRHLKIDNIQTCCVYVNIEASVDESGKKDK